MDFVRVCRLSLTFYNNTLPSFTNSARDSATVGRLEQVQLCKRLIDQSVDNITGLKCAKECLILKYKYIQNPWLYFTERILRWAHFLRSSKIKHHKTNKHNNRRQTNTKIFPDIGSLIITSHRQWSKTQILFEKALENSSEIPIKRLLDCNFELRKQYRQWNNCKSYINGCILISTKFTSWIDIGCT